MEVVKETRTTLSKLLTYGIISLHSAGSSREIIAKRVAKEFPSWWCCQTQQMLVARYVCERKFYSKLLIVLAHQQNARQLVHLLQWLIRQQSTVMLLLRQATVEHRCLGGVSRTVAARNLYTEDVEPTLTTLCKLVGRYIYIYCSPSVVMFV